MNSLIVWFFRLAPLLALFVVGEVIGHYNVVGYTHLSGEASLGAWVGQIFFSFAAALVCVVLSVFTRKNGFGPFFTGVTFFFLGMTVSCFMPL